MGHLCAAKDFSFRPTVDSSAEQAENDWMLSRIWVRKGALASSGGLLAEMASGILGQTEGETPVAVELTGPRRQKRADSVGPVLQGSEQKISQKGAAGQIEPEGGGRPSLSPVQRLKMHPVAKVGMYLENRDSEGMKALSEGRQPIRVDSSAGSGDRTPLLKQESLSAHPVTVEGIKSQRAGTGRRDLQRAAAETDLGTAASEHLQAPFPSAKVEASRLSATAEEAFRHLPHGTHSPSTPVRRAASEVAVQLNRQGLEPSVISQVVQNARILKSNPHAEIKMRLKPEQLGQVRIRLVIQNSAISADVSVENPDVREIITANLNQLRESLLQEGILVENFNVSVDSEGRSGKGESEVPWLSDLQDDLSAPEKADDDDMVGNPWGLYPVMISVREHLVDYTA